MIPITIILIPYALFLVIFIFFSLINIYHMIKFGTTGFLGFLTVVIYIGIAALILNTTYNIGITLDWSRQFDLFSSFGAPTF